MIYFAIFEAMPWPTGSRVAVHRSLGQLKIGKHHTGHLLCTPSIWRDNDRVNQFGLNTQVWLADKSGPLPVRLAMHRRQASFAYSYRKEFQKTILFQQLIWEVMMSKLATFDRLKIFCPFHHFCLPEEMKNIIKNIFK